MNRPKRQDAIINYLRPQTQPMDSSEDAITKILEGLQELQENGDLVALLQVAAQANGQAQRLISDQAIAARKSA